MSTKYSHARHRVGLRRDCEREQLNRRGQHAVVSGNRKEVGSAGARGGSASQRRRTIFPRGEGDSAGQLTAPAERRRRETGGRHREASLMTDSECGTVLASDDWGLVHHECERLGGGWKCAARRRDVECVRAGGRGVRGAAQGGRAVVVVDKSQPIWQGAALAECVRSQEYTKATIGE